MSNKLLTSEEAGAMLAAKQSQWVCMFTELQIFEKYDLLELKENSERSSLQ
jgi:hypothetical protein